MFTPRVLIVLFVAALGFSRTGSLPVDGLEQAPAEPVVTLRIIVVGTIEEAQGVLDRLKKGENFAVVAKGVSTGPGADGGGWLGKQTLAQLRPEIRSAIQGLSPGEISSPVRIPTGFAILKVEENDRSSDVATVGAALAATGAVRLVADISGLTEARTAIDLVSKRPGWMLDPRAVCDVRTRALAETRSAIEAELAGLAAGTARPRSPLDVMQLHVGLAQLHTYEGRMASAIVHHRDALRIALKDVPDAAPALEETLGVAHFHKATMDSGQQGMPGDTCLLGSQPRTPLSKPADTQAALQYFERYLSRKPDDLEVRWLLNLVHMATGGYPGSVPAKYLIPPAALTSSDDIGRFRDVAREAGLVSIGSAGGLIVEDLRGMGRFDVVTSAMESCGPVRLFANNGDGTFADRTEASGLAGVVGGLNMVPGDFNNDGCQDILVLRGGWESMPQRMSLLRNNCQGVFTDVTVTSGLGDPVTSQTAAWADIDNDGFLDLFVGVENEPSRLFRNRGDGTFADISASARVNRVAFTKGVTAIDYDNDRYPDFHVSNYGSTNFLYHNNRDNTFTDVAGVARVPGTTMSFATWFFDYDNDGWSDLFVNSYVPSVDEVARGHLGLPLNGVTLKLYRNSRDGTFRDVSAEAGLARVHMPMGANFGDIDNDGFPDIYLGTGQPSYAATVGSLLLRNKQGLTFEDVSTASGTAEWHKGHGVAFADLDHDGDEDIVFEVGGATPGDRHALRLFENPGHGNDWLAVKLVGVKSNRSAIGARISVTVEDDAGRKRQVFRTVGTGGSFGASPLLQHVGLGRGERTVDIKVAWPTSNTGQHFTAVPKNQWVQIEEFATSYTTLKRDQVTLGGPRRSQ